MRFALPHRPEVDHGRVDASAAVGGVAPAVCSLTCLYGRSPAHVGAICAAAPVIIPINDSACVCAEAPRRDAKAEAVVADPAALAAKVEAVAVKGSLPRL